MATNIFTGLLKNLSSDNTYYYDTYYEDERCDTSSPRQVGTYVTVVVFSIVILLSLFGNILVMVILVKYENIKSLSNVLIMNLAVSDLLFTIGLPLWIHSQMTEWTLGKPTCKTVMFVFYVGYYSSSILLVLMTAHRYIAVMRPLSSIMSNKGFCSALASPVIWVVSLIFAAPALFFTNVLQNSHCVTVSSNWTLFGIYQQNFFFFLNSVVFLFCYPQIICRLLRPTTQKRKSKTLKLIFILMVVFLVTWAPYNIVIFLKSFQFYPNSHDAPMLQGKCIFTKNLEYTFYISRLFAFSQCCLNPVFYVFVGVKFKKHLKKILKSWGRKRPNNGLQGRHRRFTVTSVTSGEESAL